MIKGGPRDDAEALKRAEFILSLPEKLFIAVQSGKCSNCFSKFPGK